MRVKVLYILMIVFGCSLTAAAQRHGHVKAQPKRKATPAKKTRHNTQTAKSSKPIKRNDEQSESHAAASDTTIKGATIEIIQSYKPEVKKAEKPQLSANVPPADTAHPSFTYEVPTQNLYYTYSSLPLRPLALGRDTTQQPYANYIKLGGGNLSTLYGDASIASLKGLNYETIFHLHHISQTGEYSDQKTSLSSLGADGTYHNMGKAWHAGIDAFRNMYHYYGYDHDLFNYNSDQTKQIFTGIHVNVDMKNEDEGFRGISYHPHVGFSYYGDHYKTNENTIAFDLPLSYFVDSSLQLQLGLDGIFTQTHFDNATVSNNIFQIKPALIYNTGDFSAHIGINPAFGKDANYILPDIALAYKIKNSQFSIIAGWESTLRQNSYEQLTMRNPYMLNTYLVQQSHNTEVYGGIQGNVGNHITVSGRVSWLQYQHMPLFINDTATGDEKKFIVVYDDKVNAVSLQGAIRYQVGNSFSAGFSAAYYSYSSSSYHHVWHEPGIRLKGDLMVHPLPQLVVTGYLSMLDEIWALEKNDQSVKLDGFFDIGVGAEYNFIPRLSAFIQVNNLLNNKYERWYGYQAYGINIFGGLRLKF